MQTLDQTLTEVEPIFRDGTFVMPSFQEALTAKQFADEINSGQLSVRDAYRYCWSYEEDAELWELPQDQEWRALLPDWKNVLLHMAGRLDDDKAEELVIVVAGNSHITNTILEERSYHPFQEDYLFSFKLASQNESVRNELGHRLINQLTATNDLNEKIRLLYYIDELKYSDSTLIELRKDVDFFVSSMVLESRGRITEYHQSLLELLRSKDEFTRRALVVALGDIGKKDPKLLDLLKEGDELIRDSVRSALVEIGYSGSDLQNLVKDEGTKDEVRSAALFAWEQLGNYDSGYNSVDEMLDEFSMSGYIPWFKETEGYDPRLVDLLVDKNENLRAAAAWALGQVGHYHPRLVDLLGDKNATVRQAAVRALGKTKHYDPRLGCLLEDKIAFVRKAATWVYGKLKQYDTRLMDLLNDQDVEIIRIAIWALGEIDHYDTKLIDLLGDRDTAIRNSAITALSKIKDHHSLYHILKDIKANYGLTHEGRMGEVIKEAHQRLKPQGYNPAVKRLAA